MKENVGVYSLRFYAECEASTKTARQIRKQLNIFSLEALLLQTVAVQNIRKYQRRSEKDKSGKDKL